MMFPLTMIPGYLRSATWPCCANKFGFLNALEETSMMVGLPMERFGTNHISRIFPGNEYR